MDRYVTVHRARILAITFSLLVIAMLGYAGSHADWDDTHVNYGADGVVVVEPENNDVCPGEVLFFSVPVRVLDIPGTAIVADSWFDTVNQYTLPKTRMWELIPLARHRVTTVDNNRVVPDGLLPGRIYEIHHTATVIDNGTSAFIVTPIRIREDCNSIN